MVIIGVDPDSEAHGVAVYRDGQLKSLLVMQSIHLAEYARDNKALVSIEDVKANKFVYGRNKNRSRAVQDRVAISVGKCQQAQTELTRLLQHYGVKFELYRPQAGNWAKNKKSFERVTMWTGRSNEDTRSAAFFGFLALRKMGVA